MKIFEQIKVANQECETLPEFLKLWYTVFAGLLICIPLLYIVGFICGILFIKNPHKSAKAVIDGVF